MLSKIHFSKIFPQIVIAKKFRNIFLLSFYVQTAKNLLSIEQYSLGYNSCFDAKVHQKIL